MPLDGERSVALLQLPDMGSKLRLLLLYLNLLLDGHCGATVGFFFLRSRDRSAVLPISFFEGPHTLSKVRVCLFGGCVSDVSSVHKVFCKTLSLEWAVAFPAFQAVAEALTFFMFFSC